MARRKRGKHTPSIRTAHQQAQRNNEVLYGLGAILILVALVLFLVFHNSESRSSAAGPPRMGKPAPIITLTDLNGNRVSLADFEGQVVLVNFWATWCPPCKAEMPDIQRLYEEFASQGFTVLSIDMEESPQAVAQFRDVYGLTFPIAIDPQGSVNPAYAIRGLPTSWLVDKKGVLRYIWTGRINTPDIERRIRDLL